MKIMQNGLTPVQPLSPIPSPQKTTEVLIKFFAPEKLKTELTLLANSRNVSLSALLRLALSEYVRDKG
jgi:hypothetical protein